MFKSNIYTVGGTVQAGNGLYIPRKGDDELLELCRSGVFAYILTARQMGKSSLMVRAAQRLAAENVRSVIIDLTQVGTQVTPEEWYVGLLAAIEDQISLRTDIVEWWQDHSDLGITQRLTLFFQEVLLREIPERIVIFVDEIDTTLSLPFTDDFFAAIRFLYNARGHMPEFHRLSFVLIGVAKPRDLIRDPQRTPFNIGEQVELTDFNSDEAIPLATGLGLLPDQTQSILKWVLKWTNGHPYLTQRLFRAVVEENKTTWTESDVDQLVNRTFFGENTQQDNNLQFVADMLTKRAADPADTLVTYRKILRSRHSVADEEHSRVKSHLKLSGIVRRENSALRVRNAIYKKAFDARWVGEHLPSTWIKQQYQRTQKIAGGLALLLVILGLLSGYAWKQRSTAIARTVELNALLATVEKARNDAEESASKERAARDEADSKRKEADIQRLHAIAEQKRAEEARERESLAKKQVDEQRQIALLRGQTDRLYRDGTELFLRNEQSGAITKFGEALALYRNPHVKDRAGEAITLRNIASAYQSSRNRQQALSYYNQALAVYKSIPGKPGRSGEASTLLSMCLLESPLSGLDKKETQEYLDQPVKMYQQAGDLSGKAKALLSIARAIPDQNIPATPKGLSETAKQKLRYLLSALEAYREAHDQSGISSALEDIAKTYKNWKDIPNAITAYDDLSKVYGNINNLSGKADALKNIGELYIQSNDGNKAIEYLFRAHETYRQANDSSGMQRTITTITNSTIKLNEGQKIIEYFEQLLEPYRKSNNSEKEAELLRTIGKLYYDSGNKQMAITYYNKALALYTNSEDEDQKADVLEIIGYIYNGLGEKALAKVSYSEALASYKKSKNKYKEGKILSALGELSYSEGDKSKALEYFNKLFDLNKAAPSTLGGRDDLYILQSLKAIHNELGEPEKMLKIYDDFVTEGEGEKKRRGPERIMTLWELSVRSGELLNSRAYLDEVLGIYRDSKDISRQIDLLESLARLFAVWSPRDKSLAIANELYNLLSTSNDRSPSRLVDDWEELAAIYMALEQRQKASEIYQKINSPFGRNNRDTDYEPSSEGPRVNP